MTNFDKCFNLLIEMCHWIYRWYRKLSEFPMVICRYQNWSNNTSIWN